MTTRKKIGPKRNLWWAYILVGLLIFAAGATLIWGYYFSSWKGKERFTTISITDGVVVRSFDPISGQGVVIKLPDNLEIETLQNRGKWRVGVMGEVASKYDRKWALESVADFLGIFYTADADRLGLFDRWSWWKWGKQIKWVDVDMESSRLIKQVVSVDGEKLLTLSPDWDLKAQELFLSNWIADEEVNVTIVNTTEINGLGAHAARPIESAGMRVAMVSNEKTDLEECVAETNQATSEFVGVGLIVGEFNCKWSLTEDNLDGEVVIRLGRKYGQWWKGD